MEGFTAKQEKSLRAVTALAAWLIFDAPHGIAPAGRQACSPQQTAPPAQAYPSDGDEAGRVLLSGSAAEYIIRASVFILGDMGTVGSAVLERRLERTDKELIKTLKLSGRTKPEMAKKGRDIGGEFTTVTSLPLNAYGEIGQASPEDRGGVSSSYHGMLAKNGLAKGEKVIFYPDYALSTRDDGLERKVEGRFESVLAAFEFFLENPAQVGDTYQSRFILDGRPYIFKCEMGKLEVLEPYGVKAYRIDVTTFDGKLKDSRGAPRVLKKKGGIRLWICKEDDYKNEILRLRLQYKWYLTLFFDLKRRGGNRSQKQLDNSGRAS